MAKKQKKMFVKPDAHAELGMVERVAETAISYSPERVKETEDYFEIQASFFSNARVQHTGYDSYWDLSNVDISRVMAGMSVGNLHTSSRDGLKLENSVAMVPAGASRIEKGDDGITRMHSPVRFLKEVPEHMKAYRMFSAGVPLYTSARGMSPSYRDMEWERPEAEGSRRSLTYRNLEIIDLVLTTNPADMRVGIGRDITDVEKNFFEEEVRTSMTEEEKKQKEEAERIAKEKAAAERDVSDKGKPAQTEPERTPTLPELREKATGMYDAVFTARDMSETEQVKFRNDVESEARTLANGNPVTWELYAQAFKDLNGKAKSVEFDADRDVNGAPAIVDRKNLGQDRTQTDCGRLIQHALGNITEKELGAERDIQKDWEEEMKLKTGNGLPVPGAANPIRSFGGPDFGLGGRSIAITIPHRTLELDPAVMPERAPFDSAGGDAPTSFLTPQFRPTLEFARRLLSDSLFFPGEVSVVPEEQYLNLKALRDAGRPSVTRQTGETDAIAESTGYTITAIDVFQWAQYVGRFDISNQALDQSTIAMSLLLEALREAFTSTFDTEEIIKKALATATLVAIGANGGPLTWALITQLMGKVRGANANFDRSIFGGNSEVWAQAIQKAKFGSGSDSAVVVETSSGTTIQGKRFLVSNNFPHGATKGTLANPDQMVFGDFKDIFLAFYSGLIVLIDPYTDAANNKTRIFARQAMDSFVGHQNESFAKIADINVAG